MSDIPQILCSSPSFYISNNNPPSPDLFTLNVYQMVRRLSAEILNQEGRGDIGEGIA